MASRIKASRPKTVPTIIEVGSTGTGGGHWVIFSKMASKLYSFLFPSLSSISVTFTQMPRLGLSLTLSIVDRAIHWLVFVHHWHNEFVSVRFSLNGVVKQHSHPQVSTLGSSSLLPLLHIEQRPSSPHSTGGSSRRPTAASHISQYSPLYGGSHTHWSQSHTPRFSSVELQIFEDPGALHWSVLHSHFSPEY